MREPRILCVDPEVDAQAATASTLKAGFKHHGAVIKTESELEAAIERLAGEHLDCVVTELELPDGSGLDLVKAIRKESPDTGCLIYTDASLDRVESVLGGDTEVLEVLSKTAPEAETQLIDIVERIVADRVQSSYPVPEDEAARLDALDSYDFEQAAIKPALDRATSLLSQHLDVSAASINLVGSHDQQFYACQGPATEWGSTPREESICTFTILEDDGLLVIEDVQGDPRFAEVDRLEALGIRAYIGATLRTPSGEGIGTLCAYADEPRSFTSEERRFQRTLADLVMDLLEPYRETSAGPQREGEQ